MDLGLIRPGGLAAVLLPLAEGSASGCALVRDAAGDVALHLSAGRLVAVGGLSDVDPATLAAVLPLLAGEVTWQPHAPMPPDVGPGALLPAGGVPLAALLRDPVTAPAAARPAWQVPPPRADPGLDSARRSLLAVLGGTGGAPGRGAAPPPTAEVAARPASAAGPPAAPAPDTPATAPLAPAGSSAAPSAVAALLPSRPAGRPARRQAGSGGAAASAPPAVSPAVSPEVPAPPLGSGLGRPGPAAGGAERAAAAAALAELSASSAGPPPAAPAGPPETAPEPPAGRPARAPAPPRPRGDADTAALLRELAGL